MSSVFTHSYWYEVLYIIAVDTSLEKSVNIFSMDQNSSDITDAANQVNLGHQLL